MSVHAHVCCYPSELVIWFARPPAEAYKIYTTVLYLGRFLCALPSVSTVLPRNTSSEILLVFEQLLSFRVAAASRHSRQGNSSSSRWSASALLGCRFSLRKISSSDSVADALVPRLGDLLKGRNLELILALKL